MSETPQAGLCADCLFARVVETARRSRFYRCLRAQSDPRYRRYPRLPVLACAGYEPRERKESGTFTES